MTPKLGKVDNINISNEFYENLGDLPKQKRLSQLDQYRYKYVSAYLCGESVLDVGAYYGDFLKLGQKMGYEIKGTEINDLRVSIANENLGGNYVRKDFLHGKLSSFSDSSVDTVVCMEVLEHLEDDKFGLSELFRVAKRRVIITVPYNEKVRTVLCVHCNRYTPLSGHLHQMYDESSFDDCIPESWEKIKTCTFGNTLTKFIYATVPIRISLIDFALSRIYKDKNNWIVQIFDKQQ
ncbi:class I SAM-dependent methyltransferase [Methanoculleus taiwanensis]|uniref:class I SAM-dependent methyltransferase n=1 Tax=Methanoculleus taiwanensis TaxID=1550565 RepID=UPI000FFE660B|nr:methyltransferase domain-containing protein [Methanoculleus taiwanensis]